MKKAYKLAKYCIYFQKTITQESGNHTVKRLVLFSMVLTLTTLLMSISDQPTYEACDDIYIITDLHCASTDITTSNESITNELKEFTSQSHMAEVAHMGFSFSPIWDFLVSRFSIWKKEETPPDIISKNNTQFAINADSTLCDCEEYIYLNDTQLEGVHKFLVVGDTVSEVLAANGGPWLQTPSSPHSTLKS